MPTSYSRWISVFLLASSTVGCTGGEVLYGGEGAAGATVQYENCDGDVWARTTNSDGRYVFNPFDPDSSAFIEANYIPEGVYLASAQLGPWKRVDMVSHQYDETCEIEWNGTVQDLPCTRRDFDLGFIPQSGWEYNSKKEHQEEHNELQIYSFRHEYCIHFGGGDRR